MDILNAFLEFNQSAAAFLTVIKSLLGAWKIGRRLKSKTAHSKKEEKAN